MVGEVRGLTQASMQLIPGLFRVKAVVSYHNIPIRDGILDREYELGSTPATSPGTGESGWSLP